MIPARDGLPARGEAGAFAERQCMRQVGDQSEGTRICGEKPAIHIMWEDASDGMEPGWACAEHASEAVTRWKPLAVHPVGADCGMPGSMFFLAENVCRVEDIPVAEPVRAIAEKVPA